MSRLTLHLLGSPEVRLDDQPVVLRERKALALLVYLAVTAEPHQREALATLFWPEHDAKRSRTYLRRILWGLRQTLGDGWIAADGDEIRLAQSADIWTDVTQLKSCLAQKDASPLSQASLATLEQAVALYRGDFLTGFGLADSPAFDEWQFFEAETIRQAVISALDNLVLHYEQTKSYEAAIGHARRRLALDALHEPAHQTLMRLYALSGRQAAALRQFDECRRILQDELGVAPDSETQALAADIREKRLVPAERVMPPGQVASAHNIATLMRDPLAAKQTQSVMPPRAVFIGRAQQLRELERALAEALKGQGQLRIITGEAGAGKSALITEFLHQTHSKQPELIITMGASDAQTGQVNPFLPFREALLKLIDSGDDAWRSTISVALLEQGPDLFHSFIPAADHPGLIATAQAAGWQGEVFAQKPSFPGQPAPEQSKIIAQYEAVLKAVTALHPLILVLEDLHWADSASLGLLFRLGQQLAHHRLFMLASYRSEQAHLLSDDQENALGKMLYELQRHHGDITIDLEAVRMTEGRVLVDGLLDTEPNQLNDSFRQALYHHTGGHPLFVVELLEDLKGRAALVRNSAGDWMIGDKLDWRNLPGRVEGAVGGRIAQLSDEQRWLLTIASVSGERFLAEVVAHVGGLDNRTVMQALSQELQAQHRLVEAEHVERLGDQRLTYYRFRHNLIQVYLYEQLDEVQRTYLHEDVAKALEALYGEQIDQIVVQLARHYQAAGVTQKAIDYLILAGEQARRLAANDEAIEHFTQADRLLATRPENRKRQQQTFVVQFNLGQALTASKGNGTKEAGLALMRALEVGRQLGESHQLVRVLFALVYHAGFAVELNAAQAYGEECLRLAEESQDPELQMEAHRTLQMVTYLSQQYAASAAHAEQVSAFYHTHRPNLTDEEAYDLITALAQAGFVLIPLGYPDQALRQGKEAVALMRRHNHPLGKASAFGALASFHRMRGEWRPSLQFGEEQRGLGVTHDFFLNRTYGELHVGAALARLGEVDAGVALVRQAIAERVARGINQSHAHYLTQVAEACGQAGRITEGVALVNEALTEIDNTNDRYDESKSYQVKGDLLLLQNVADDQRATAQQEAEVCFRQAIEIAQSHQARLWEARALASLCRLLHSQGRDEGCRQRLADLYAWFTEGFETEDLRVVRAVLQEVAQ